MKIRAWLNLLEIQRRSCSVFVTRPLLGREELLIVYHLLRNGYCVLSEFLLSALTRSGVCRLITHEHFLAISNFSAQCPV